MSAMTATVRPTGTSFATKLPMFQPDIATRIPSETRSSDRRGWASLMGPFHTSDSEIDMVRPAIVFLMARLSRR